MTNRSEEGAVKRGIKGDKGTNDLLAIELPFCQGLLGLPAAGASTGLG